MKGNKMIRSCTEIVMLVLSFISDTKRAVGLLKQYQASLTSPDEQALKTSVEKVSTIFGSHLFHALLGEVCFSVSCNVSKKRKIDD